MAECVGANNIVRGKFAEKILNKIRCKADGSIIDRILDEKPSRKLFIGNLSPKKKLSELSYIYSKTTPSSAGFEVLISKKDVNNGIIRIKMKSAFYYKVFPTLEEQKEIFKQQDEGLFSRDPAGQDLEFNGEKSESSDSGYRLRTAYAKIKPIEIAFSKKISDLIKNDWQGSGLFSESDQIIEKSRQIFNNDPNRFRTKKNSGASGESKNKDLIVPRSALATDESWREFIQNWGENIPEPKWNVRLSYKIADFDNDSLKLTLVIENALEENVDKPDIENSLFETALSVEPVGFAFKNYILEYLKDDYKYDGNIHASGINCSAVKEGAIVRFEHMPVFVQKKEKSTEHINPDFNILSSNPMPLLKSLSALMKQEIEDLKQTYQSRSDLTEQARSLFRNDINDFIEEVRRFNNGIISLQNDSQAMEAFSLMNKTFAQSSKGFSSWRLFQIAFIVMEIPDILAASGRGSSTTAGDVDLIYFPTGGGKTEAYLGLVVFTIFFDRLRGKKEGVSAITRFPLRLLSLQQLQRIADIFAKAELLRRKHPLISSAEYAQFSTGYYVGGDNTPNSVYKAGSRFNETEDEISPINTDPDKQDKYKIISKCPFCGEESIILKGDMASLRIIHQCTNPRCKEEIPVYISDHEVYRYLPTFIIATLDKMASVAWSKEFKTIFGSVSGKCPKHGFFTGDHCLYWKKPYHNEDPNLCKVEQYLPVNLFDPVPTLIIQDEMHLIRESLGTYDSHYETFLQNYAKEQSGGKQVKIIGSSATMTEYWSQIRQLYMKKGHQFPSNRHFYTWEDREETSRLIAGVMPHNKTVIFAVLDLIEMYYEAIQELKKNPLKAIEMNIGFNSVEEVSQTLNDYDLGLSYNLVKLEGDAISQSIRTMVNVDLKKRMIREMVPARMTGDVTFRDVKEILKTVESSNPEKPLDLIVATSMISHGVDIDKMNFMVFRGMPRNTAEYIQAYSRVGRKYPGIIFVVFNPARERDQSYYKYFSKYHEYKDILVEPVPLNRWAKFAVNRTLPGIFAAYILNFVKDGSGKSPYMTNTFREAITSQKITVDQITKFVLACYQCSEQDMGPYYHEYIRNKVQNYVDQILAYDGKPKFIPMMMSDKPLMSLRDMDIPIELNPTRESYHPMTMVRAQYSRSVE
ncbi:MAG: helicase-related protein [Methanoregula sp.]|nr:helicase-related protein [Methanoregula sp.]